MMTLSLMSVQEVEIRHRWCVRFNLMSSSSLILLRALFSNFFRSIFLML